MTWLELYLYAAGALLYASARYQIRGRNTDDVFGCVGRGLIWPILLPVNHLRKIFGP